MVVEACLAASRLARQAVHRASAQEAADKARGLPDKAAAGSRQGRRVVAADIPVAVVGKAVVAGRLVEGVVDAWPEQAGHEQA